MSNGSLGKRTERGAEMGIELHDQGREPWQDAEWQRLWLAVEAKPWRSLALVPAGDGAASDFTLVIALTLSRTGMVHMGSPVQVADATHITLSQLSAFNNEVKRYTDSGQRLLMALPSVIENAVTASIVQSVDAAVLCVLANKMSTAHSKKTIKEVGQARFLGSAIFHPHNFSQAPAPPPRK